MNTEGSKRKLSAILSADVVDWKRRMGENKISTEKILFHLKGTSLLGIDEWFIFKY